MESSSRRPFQFRLRTLVLAVTVCALALGTTRWLGWASAPFVATSLGVWAVAGWKSRHFFIWLAPTLYTFCAFGSWRHPGDEYGMLLVTFLPAFWLAPFLESGHVSEVIYVLIAAGALPVTIVGFVLDRMAVWRRAWAVCYLATVAGLVPWSLSGYESLERAISKNGSIQAYVYSAANLGLYASLLLFLVIGIIVGAYRRIRGKRRNDRPG